MIQRYDFDPLKDDQDKLIEIDDGDYVLYEDHLKEVEDLKLNLEILESVKEDHKQIRSLLDSAKPKWIPGPPTTTGWHWLKHCLPDFVLVKNIKSIDYQYIRSVSHEVIPTERITHHCPIRRSKNDL